jgi:acetate CoA/acetoacetate CoA-transferase beta subunit
VNLGIGLPTLVAAYVPKDIDVFFHSENGIVGMSPLPGEGFEDRNPTDAGGRPVGALPGACAFDSAFSFGLIRGGNLDVTVLGGQRARRSCGDARCRSPGRGAWI